LNLRPPGYETSRLKLAGADWPVRELDRWLEENSARVVEGGCEHGFCNAAHCEIPGPGGYAKNDPSQDDLTAW
jgi:hypothetical protein